MKTDVLIVGCGCAGLYCALHLDKEKKVTIITKSDLESSDSFLAQGGMCMLKDDSDYEAYFEDTMKAGHYENDRDSVEIMIRSSARVVEELVKYGVEFQREVDGSFAFTREGAHSDKRILFHEDITGKEITRKLLAQAQNRENITLMEYTEMKDILCKDNVCYGAIARFADGTIQTIYADYTVLATGGIGGLYQHSTNFRHLTGDGAAVAAKHGIELKDMDYIQIHPTTLYSDKEEDRSFLISESVRGEGAKLYGKDGKRFVNELLPRDCLTEAIYRQMEKDGTEYVWEDLRVIPKEKLFHHFPNIVAHCQEMGYDVTRECIPVVPAQHYFMGGIRVDHQGRTSMERLYAAGETACNGVHGKNRLASNSLLESLVFAGRAAEDIMGTYQEVKEKIPDIGMPLYEYADSGALAEEYKEIVWSEIRKARKERDV
ncbi:L-aspartate oxidase [Sellimonas intestinalis]|uniref:L-aspartate oxidase n=1 Tax=Sellimonas intestinalis TaxID=1653434 RepID=UPI003AB39624